MTGAVDLSICIINHRTPDLLRACLQSIAATAAPLSVETWIVNNTGDDAGAIREMVQAHPNARLIQNERPLGFSANQNQMLERAIGRYLMPLNSDTLVQPGALAELVAFMDQHPDAGIAGPRLVRANGALQPSCRNFPTPLTHFLEAAGLWQALRGNRWIGRRFYLAGPHDTVMSVDWLTGACLIVRAEAARQVGFYNAKMFPGLYGEDLEWCWRMKQAGWQILFDPAATVVHLENQSPLDDRTIHMYRGFYQFCACHYPASQQRRIRLATRLALLPRLWASRNPQVRNIYRQLIALEMPACAPDIMPL
ncbi:MAG: glycosyl transferase [Candidatus Roseilinea sp.]|nr:MAG: glycosyl transferase [Candidatus Roseilinea sp.]